MKRREFITLLGGAAAAWPLAAHAQQPAMPVSASSPSIADAFVPRLAGFLQGLALTGLTRAATSRSKPVGRRTARSIAGARRRINASSVDVISSTGGLGGALVARQTRTVPIVFPVAGDPVRAGFTSLNRPGGNATGISRPNAEVGKRLELLYQIVPGAISCGARQSGRPGAGTQVAAIQAAAPFSGGRLTRQCCDASEIEGAVAAFTQLRARPDRHDPSFYLNRRIRSSRWRHGIRSRRSIRTAISSRRTG